jgi:hypothetical protein
MFQPLNMRRHMAMPCLRRHISITRCDESHFFMGWCTTLISDLNPEVVGSDVQCICNVYIYILLLYIIHIYFFLYSVYVMDCVCSVYMCIYHMMYRETGKHRDTYGQKQKHSGILSSRDHCMKRKLDITTTRWLLCQAGIPLSSDLERYSRSMYDVLCTGPQSVHCFASTSLLPTPIRSIFISNPAATQNFVKMYWAQIFSKHFLDDTNMFSHVSTFTPNHCGP